MICIHCGSDKYIKNGSSNGVRRYKCKSCNRSFGDNIRKFTFADKQRFLLYYLNNTGVRKCALFMGCSPSLIVRWVRELASNVRKELESSVKDLSSVSLPAVIEMDELYTQIKKWGIPQKYGLLLIGSEVRLLPLR
jgi:insertion element IS1 protein InsB